MGFLEKVKKESTIVIIILTLFALIFMLKPKRNTQINMSTTSVVELRQALNP